jgi:fumigallin biosynthesis monooxygenase-like protein
MKDHAQQMRTRFTVDLSAYPDLVVIYLGLRVNSLRGLFPALQFGPKLKQAVKENPAGLLRHELLFFSLYPLHLGIRQYWRDFESLERWARSSVHAGWWKGFVQRPTGYGLWHETYFIRGGMEAIYGDVPPPLGLTGFAPIRPATGAGFSSRSRLQVTGEQTVAPPISESEIPPRDVPPVPPPE